MEKKTKRGHSGGKKNRQRTSCFEKSHLSTAPAKKGEEDRGDPPPAHKADQGPT